MINSDTLTHASLLIQLSEEGPAREVAWNSFYEIYAPIIASFARRMGTDPREVDELVQDVISAFYERSPEFVYDPTKGRFRSYLRTCVWRKMITRRRKRSAEGARIEHSEPDEVAIDATWNDVWETERLGRALVAVRQRYAVNADRRRTFQAFEMCTVLDRSVEQVAAALNMTPANVRKAKSRVSMSLREEFDQLEVLNA